MMKKTMAFIVTFVGIVGTVVTIWGGERLQSIAKVITIIAFLILIILAFLVIRDYFVKQIKKIKVLLSDLLSLKDTLNKIETIKIMTDRPCNALTEEEQLNNIKTIKKITDNLSELNKKVVKLDETVNKIIEESIKNFNDTCNQTRKKVNGCQEEIIAKLNDKSYFQYHTTDVTTQLKNLLDTNKKIDEIRIICFGRSGYGEIVQHIEEKGLPIKLKIIVCNPKKNQFICNQNDLRKINELIDVMLRIKAEIYLSDIPPAIRASTVYVKGEAIWSVTQSYQFKRVSDKKIELTRPKESLIVTCDEHNSKRDFDGIVKCFQSEYERLLEKYLIPKKDNDGNIHYIKDDKKDGALKGVGD